MISYINDTTFTRSVNVKVGHVVTVYHCAKNNMSPEVVFRVMIKHQMPTKSNHIQTDRNNEERIYHLSINV